MYNPKYIESVKSKFPLSFIAQKLNTIKNLKVLVIGDSILDEYVFTFPKGRAIKDPILSLGFVKNERYAGGILAIANHVAGFADNVDLITLLGDINRNEDFIKQNLNTKINVKFFTKKNSPTTHKKRYIDHIRNGKLFKVEFLDDKPVDQETEQEIISYLKETLPKYDLVVVGDFGHGFINNEIVKTLEDHSKFIAANVQTNSSNMGYNYITKYNKINYLTSNENEIRLALSERFADTEELVQKLRSTTDFKNFLLTQGSAGCLYIKDEEQYSAPSLTNKIRDVVGAGDAVFAITSLFAYLQSDGSLLPFIANCVGGIAVNIMGNKEPITRENLMSFIEGLR